MAILVSAALHLADGYLRDRPLVSRVADLPRIQPTSIQHTNNMARHFQHDAMSAAMLPNRHVPSLRVSPLGRGVAIVALAGIERLPPADLVARLRKAGATVYVTHGLGGCLRAATSVGPRVIFVDAALPDRLVRLLRGHPRSSPAVIVRIDFEDA